MNKNSTTDQLLNFLDESYNRQSWHGSNLRGSIRGLTMQQSLWRSSPSRHNIWEIVVHCAYWKYTVRRRLTGEKRGSFPLKGSNWFPRTSAQSSAVWKSDVRLLEEMHRALIESVTHTPSASLHKHPNGSKFSNLQTIRGIALHDIYHAGQIQLLKRLQR